MSGTTPKRVALWAHPRSLSTAMVMSFNNYGNVEVFNEMYGAAFAFGPEKKMIMPIPLPFEDDLTFGMVKSELEAPYPGRDLVFMKDHAINLDWEYERLPAGFRHTFLVRDPARTLVSGVKLRGPIPIEQYAEMFKAFGKAMGYDNILALAEYAEKTLHQPPVVLDADDIRRDPEKMLRAYCRAVDLPFRESLLKWEPVTEIPWHNPKSLLALTKLNGAYDSALKSSCWLPPTSDPPDLTGLPQSLLDIMEVAKPFYEQLRAKRLQP